jgi:hypothetical protein
LYFIFPNLFSVVLYFIILGSGRIEIARVPPRFPQPSRREWVYHSRKCHYGQVSRPIIAANFSILPDYAVRMGIWLEIERQGEEKWR